MKFPSNFKVIKREWNGWTYHAAESIINGMNIIYSRSMGDDNIVNERIETYSGKNYVVGSTSPSYSRGYKIDAVPKKLEASRFLLEKFLIQEMGINLLQK